MAGTAARSDSSSGDSAPPTADEARAIGLFGLAGGFLIACFVGGLTLVAALTGWDDATAAAQRNDAAQLSTGEQVYVAECARCHGAQGEGGIGAALAGGAVVNAFPNIEDQIRVITTGRRAMPPFAGVLSPEQIEAVARYEREQLGN